MIDRALGFDQPAPLRRRKPDTASETYLCVNKDLQKKNQALKKSQNLFLSNLHPQDHLLKNQLNNSLKKKSKFKFSQYNRLSKPINPERKLNLKNLIRNNLVMKK
jgi:hypothetical protein